MKPFDLEAAKAGKKVVTRDGREYKFGAYNPEACDGERLLGWTRLDKGIWYPVYHYDRGSYDTTESPNDLFMAPEKREWWVNVYRRTSTKEIYTACTFDDESSARTAGIYHSNGIVEYLGPRLIHEEEV